MPTIATSTLSRFSVPPVMQRAKTPSLRHWVVVINGIKLAKIAIVFAKQKQKETLQAVNAKVITKKIPVCLTHQFWSPVV